MLELLVEERAVGEARQRVVERQLPELLLRLPLGGDIEQVALEIQRGPVVVDDDDAFVPDPDDPSVSGDQPILETQRIVCPMGAGMSRQHALAIVRVQQPDEEIVAASHSAAV